MGNLCTHRVAPRSEGDGLHVMVGNDLQDRSTVRCSSSVPSLAHLPWDWPSVGITSSRSPGYEPQATRRRAETPGELLRPGSKLRDLQGRGSLKVSRDRSQKAFRVLLRSFCHQEWVGWDILDRERSAQQETQAPTHP